MKISIKTLINSILEYLHLKRKAPAESLMESPIPPELFNADQMERYGITLALSHTLTKKLKPDILLGRLSESEAILVKSRDMLVYKTTDMFSPAREWLLDNFYLIQEQINTIRRNLPKGYGRTLPQIVSTVKGYPRVYDIALEIIQHSDGHWDLENLSRLIAAYQGVTKLTLGELWAIPITLGVALIENLSSVSQRIVANRNDRLLADRFADRMIEVALSEPKKLVMIIADMARSDQPMSMAFIAELARRLQGAALTLALSWLEQHLLDTGLTIEQLVLEENRLQAADQVTIRTSIASLRRLSKVNWHDFVEKMSVIEQTLRNDPSSVYSQMDFVTRDRYRHVIEELSRRSYWSEEAVALSTIQLAKINADHMASNETSTEIARHSHVGFYLIGKGLSQLKQALGTHRSLWEKLCSLANQYALASYVGCIILLTGLFVYGTVLLLRQDGIHGAWLWIAGIAMAVYSSQLAVALVNLSATWLVDPKPLPRMDFSQGIPSSYRTLVVVPAMIGSAEGIESLVEALAVRFLGNRDKHLHFMLLTDFNDAATEHMPEDEALLALASELIHALNERYSRKESNVFFLCHRPRVWNACENKWMGKERKRGKLADLNNLLRRNIKAPFSRIVGNTDILSDVKYVITLDIDTQLPRETARLLVGTMVHPLNRPRYDASRQCVVEGYGILQPRVAEALTMPGPTRYVRLCGSDFGIDPYTRTVSDVYQDIFHEGSFIGKGIYDVDLYQQVIVNRFPDNRILSHDLLEGCYLHSGFISDVPLYEKSPSHYLADAKRRSRWIRGDWQLLGWLFPRVLNGNGTRVTNPLFALSRFKLFDNLRRSLVPIALLFLFILNWTLLPDDYFWLGMILAMAVLPLVMTTCLSLLRKSRDMLLRQHVANITYGMYKGAGQLILYFTCLPHEAWYSLSAILKTGWRMWVSKRHFLEWSPQDQVDQHLHDKKALWMAHMWMGPLTAFALFLVLMMSDRVLSLVCAAPLLALWFTSPIIARWLSQPFHREEPKLNPAQIRFLHRMARKTWGFFETFMTAENHWLPPDNYQEVPVEVLARRTSPTNIGLSLLANLTAYDFGYINMNQLLTRTSNTLQTMAKMERYRGHLYNWYDTQTLKPLLPRYVSTVDSGNLAGHLFTLRQGLLALADDPLLSTRYLDGLEDTWDLLASTFKAIPKELSHFRQRLEEAHKEWASWSKALTCCNDLCVIAEQIVVLSNKTNSEINETVEWSNKLLLQCSALRDEIRLFCLETKELAAHITLREIVLSNRMPTEIRLEANSRMEWIETLSHEVISLANMDVSFLYDEASHLMTIGFNVDEQRRDSSRYDLFSSESRLGSFIAIAKGQVLQESWFALGRLMVSSGGEPILVSWSGSMFEYLMPLLIMPTYPGTLLDQTYHAVVKRQIVYGKQRGVPWGVSESGFNALDTQFNYLYRAFGVPELGLKRGLEEDLVIAPYASAMALMVDPDAACLNLQRLEAANAVGKFGFYEAIDFTASRLPMASKKVIIRSFMTHHQGMSFLSFSYLLHQQPMQRRFMADPYFQATLLLLQERIPKPSAFYLQIPKSPVGSGVSSRLEESMRIFNNPNTRTPQVQLLSNGRYHLAITQAGGGYSRWKEFAITRWREDSTCDDWGLFSYVRDVVSGEFWATYYQPTGGEVENFKCTFSEAHADFSRSDRWLDLRTEVVISPEDDIELRRLRIHNRANKRRIIEFTSYGEIVLKEQAADLSEAAFNNLFVETMILPEQKAILATRRPQNDKEKPPWLCHLLNVYADDAAYTLSFETDRARFVGRGRTLASPLAMIKPGDLSNTSGSVLDPIIAIRCRITLEADALVIFDLLTGVADTRENCVALVEKYQDRRLANRIFGLAWTHGQVLLHQLNISEENAQLYGKLASAIIYVSHSRRAEPRILASNRRGQSALWGYGISGDLPIVLLYIENPDNIELVHQLIQAQAYWRRKGLMVDLIILNEVRMSYRQNLQDQILSLIAGQAATDHIGTIVARITDQVPVEDRILFQSVARIILSDKRGTLKEQLRRRRVSPPIMPLLNVNQLVRRRSDMNKLQAIPNDLAFFNGLGGFTAVGDEYIIRLADEKVTPLPWANVLANPHFGTLVSESGQSYTWIDNAHEFRLTPWENDPLKDTACELFYLRDEETGYVWSPTALPCRGRGEYQIRHGFGYSVFEHMEDGIYSELWMYVALDASIKFFVIKCRNDSLHNRKLSLTGFVSWALGDLRTKQAMHVVTELSESGAIFAQNHYNTDFGSRTAFFDAAFSHLELTERTVTGDRYEFIGRHGSNALPAALKRKRLSGRVGAGLDPCGAIQLVFDLKEGQSREIIFTLGAGGNKEQAETLVQRYHGRTAAKEALVSVRQYWQQTLNKTKVSTPDAAINFLCNGWLLYQVLSSRLWGRSGYYQSGGAFGFRDQLQDVMALTQAAPTLFRAHILLCAAHQFEEGDVQHWWHPPLNRGVRTRCSDDYLWLPYAICHYIETTGDIAVLDEVIPFLQGRPLTPEEDSYYDFPTISSNTASLYQHAVRAITHGLKYGEHGLPLMGSGDWNDGMNLVGKEGLGESVWLGFFLYSVLKQFASLAERVGDHAFAARCEVEKNKLQQHLEAEGWDGHWYRRAYFDNGTPLGSAGNSECRIDSIAQSWAVLSGAADIKRAADAMSAVYQYLVNEEYGIVKLLDPPFDNFTPNPGYIEGYVPGIRENGGQYTHAATWAAWAFAQLNEKELAWKLTHMINPINHARYSDEVNRYKIEPYVVASDVYSEAPHTGRGGWSWYTGSAGWLYRLIIETLLGVQLAGGKELRLTPLVPDDWEGFSVDYYYGKTLYKIRVTRVQNESTLLLDGVLQAENGISLLDDGQVHEVHLNFHNAHLPVEAPP